MTRAYYLGQFHLYILGVAVVVKVCVVGGGALTLLYLRENMN